jgi:hypothetical protein
MGYDYFGSTEKLDGRNYIPTDFVKYQNALTTRTTKQIDFIPKIFACTERLKREEKIISHIIPAGNDNANRPGNFLAHHLVVEKEDIKCCRGGPAWLLKKRSFCQQWQNEKTKKQYKRSIIQPNDYLKIDPPQTWLKFFQDEWKSNLQKIINTVGDPKKKCIILFDREKHKSEIILDLFYEALSWIQADERWQVTFSTFATEPLKNLGWQWIGVEKSDEAAKRIFLYNKPTIIDLP